jgi:rhamnulokinase
MEESASAAEAGTPKAIRAYLKNTGQDEVKPDDIGTISRIVYESLALTYRNVPDRIQKAAHKDIHVAGGGSKDRLLNRFMTSALALPVKAGPSEGTAMRFKKLR